MSHPDTTTTTEPTTHNWVITKSRKVHRSGCGWLRGRTMTISTREARGYTDRCSHCMTAEHGPLPEDYAR